MFSFAAVRVYCCFCFLYVLWFAIKAVSVYTCESIINGYVRAIIICFSYLLGLIFNQSRKPRNNFSSTHISCCSLARLFPTESVRQIPNKAPYVQTYGHSTYTEHLIQNSRKPLQYITECRFCAQYCRWDFVGSVHI